VIRTIAALILLSLPAQAEAPTEWIELGLILPDASPRRWRQKSYSSSRRYPHQS